MRVWIILKLLSLVHKVNRLLNYSNTMNLQTAFVNLSGNPKKDRKVYQFSGVDSDTHVALVCTIPLRVFRSLPYAEKIASAETLIEELQSFIDQNRLG